MRVQQSINRAILLCLVSAAAAAAPADGYVAYTGVAKARHSSEFLYGERQLILHRRGRIVQRAVLYTCRDGSAFARKVVSYVAADPTAPDFLLEDSSNGMREGIHEANPSADAVRTVFFRANGRDAEKSGPVPGGPGLVADAGFDEFVRAHWDNLMTGAATRMRFLLPSRLDAYTFQVQRLRREDIDGIPVEVFRLRLSGFWGLFLPGIDVYYSDTDRVLMRYDGLSDLRDASGDNLKVIIDYPSQDRKPAGEQAMQEALQATLAPCR